MFVLTLKLRLILRWMTHWRPMATYEQSPMCLNCLFWHCRVDYVLNCVYLTCLPWIRWFVWKKKSLSQLKWMSFCVVLMRIFCWLYRNDFGIDYERLHHEIHHLPFPMSKLQLKPDCWFDHVICQRLLRMWPIFGDVWCYCCSSYHHRAQQWPTMNH